MVFIQMSDIFKTGVVKPVELLSTFQKKQEKKMDSFI